MAIINIIYFLPAIVCGYWTIVFLATKKTPRQTILCGCTLVCVAYFSTYAFLTMPNTNYELLCKVDIIGVPLALLALAMMTIYINLFITKKPPTIPHMALLTPGLMYTSALAILYYILGIDNIEKITRAIDYGTELPPEMKTKPYKAFYFVDQQLTMYITLVLFLLLTMLCIWVIIKEGYRLGDFFKFFFFGKHTSPAIIISILLICLMILLLPVSLNLHTELLNYPFLNISITFGISGVCCIIAMAEYHSGIKDFTLKNIIYSKQYYEKQLAEARVAEYAKSEEIKEETENNERSYKERRHKEIIVQLRKLLEVEKIYLDPDISIIQVAEKLNIGRTMLSTLINKNFGKNFRTLINEYRIEYSKDFMKKNLSMSQEQIAFKCGFNDAPAFSHKFKEMVGVAPLSWLASEVGRNEEEEDA